jgi:Protein of unknown function (DUF3293)
MTNVKSENRGDIKRSLMQSNLVSAYKATDYVVQGNSLVVVIRIGDHSLLVDKLLAKMHAKNGAFITACNPFRKQLSLGANEYWNRELTRHLSFRGFAFVEGQGRGRTGDWPPEFSILALRISPMEASGIGRRYRQNAIVYVQWARPAELVMLRWVR